MKQNINNIEELISYLKKEKNSYSQFILSKLNRTLIHEY
jgi:hypothetical protein